MTKVNKVQLTAILMFSFLLVFSTQGVTQGISVSDNLAISAHSSDSSGELGVVEEVDKLLTYVVIHGIKVAMDANTEVLDINGASVTRGAVREGAMVIADFNEGAANKRPYASSIQIWRNP